MTATEILGYAGAAGLLIVAPGPDFAVVLRNGIGGGQRAARAAGSGVATGFLVWSIAVATGLATALAASAQVYSAIRWLGIAYLVYLGILSFASALRGHALDAGVAPSSATWRRSVWSSYREGLLTNLLNPKVAATFLALMPQFLPRHPSIIDLAILSVVTMLIAAAWFQILAAMVGTIRRKLANVSVRRALDAVTGTVLVAFGVRLATD